MASWHRNSQPRADVVASPTCSQICHDGLLLGSCSSKWDGVCVTPSPSRTPRVAWASRPSCWPPRRLRSITARASLSSMRRAGQCQPPADRQPQLEAVQSAGRTIVDYLVGAVLKDTATSWRDFVITDVSDVDVDDARSIALMPSDTALTLFEREVSKGDHESRL